MPIMVSPVQKVCYERVLKTKALHMPRANARESSFAEEWYLIDSSLTLMEGVIRISSLLLVARMARKLFPVMLPGKGNTSA